MLAEVDRFAAGEDLGGGRAVAAGEDQRGEETRVVQLGGARGHPQVVAAQADRHVRGVGLVVHLVVVPDRLGLVPLVFGDDLLAVTHAFVSLITVGGAPGGPSLLALTLSILRSWCTRPYCAAVRAAWPRTRNPSSRVAPSDSRMWP